MKKIKKSVLCILIVSTIVFGIFAGRLVFVGKNELTTQQKNAISMLNYIAVLTQDINTTKHSRVYMEDKYSSLINNINPNAVDDKTLSQLTGLLDIMENYRMIDVKRERLKYVYEQTQARAIRSAIPNPLGLLSAVHSYSLSALLTSGIYMAVDSETSYKAYTNKTEEKYLNDGWALDDEEAKNLHESRKGNFVYMVKIVNDYDLPGNLALTEDTVDEFVHWKKEDNVEGRIQFLESNKNTYKGYGGYWLTLADSYYDNGNQYSEIDTI